LSLKVEHKHSETARNAEARARILPRHLLAGGRGDHRRGVVFAFPYPLSTWEITVTLDVTPPTVPAAGEAVGTLTRPARTRLARVAMAFVALAAASVPGMAATEAKAATLKTSYGGYAYGTTMSVKGVVRSGNSAPVTLGCTTNGNLHYRNNTAAVNLAGVGRTGSVTTSADTYASPIKSRTSATTNGVNLLGGRITATAVRAVSATTRSGTTFSVSPSGTTLTGLKVNGRAISASTAPNTRINLAGIGYLVVNEQVKRSYYGLSVTALRLVVNTRNALGVPVGTSVIVSHATSSLSNPVAGVVGGYGYGTQARSGKTFDSGPSFVIFMPCHGTAGAVRTNTGAGVTVPGVRSGTTTNTVQGRVASTSVTARATSTVETANVLDGVVTASLIKSVSNGSSNGTTRTFTDTGSSFGTLKVRGSNIGPSVAPGETVAVPGVGTVSLKKVTKTSTAISVVMIEVTLSQQVNGLAPGTIIRVGVSKVQIG